MPSKDGSNIQRLFEKLEQERTALGGKVFDILGKVTFENRPLRDLLIEAVRYGNDPNVRARLFQVVDKALDREAFEELLQEHALTDDVIDIHKVMSIREEMDRIEAHRLQPHFVRDFFVDAFRHVGGRIREREKGRYEIQNVPPAVRNRDMQIGFGEPVLKRYERICFDKAYRNVQGQVPADLVSPGHPLLQATIDLIRERHMDVLKRGTIFVDDNDYGTKARLLFYIEDAVQDGVILRNGGKRVISKHVHFVEIDEDQMAHRAGYAPYLDYRAPNEDEYSVIQEHVRTEDWLRIDFEALAQAYAIEHIIPAHVADVRQRKEKMINKTAHAVKNRLTSEIQYWDYRAAELKQKEEAGKENAKLNSQRAKQRAEDLELRMQRRLAELQNEKMISATPPNIVGGALVIPRGLINRLTSQEVSTFEMDVVARQAVEFAAMKAVMDIEKSLGYEPRDVSSEKCGYDIESRIPEVMRQYDHDMTSLRFIEVKGRSKGATTVIVTKNEILRALNKPDEFILALVEVDGDETKTTYLKKPFEKELDFAAVGATYNIVELINRAEVILES